jgi:hypothetical protein
MSFISNNAEFGIVSDSEIFSIISNFSDDMIMDIIQKDSENKFRPYQYYVGNLIYALESQFKINDANYPDYQLETKSRREEMYFNILTQLCKSHGLSLNLNENTDMYSLTYFLYDFMISKFTINIINFFTNYIISESSALYDYMNFRDSKKNKDTSTLYSKKLFKDNIKLASLHANLETVIDSICGFDIDINTLITLSTNDRNIATLIMNNISEISNLFRVLFVPYVKDPRYKAILITLVRMRIQEVAGSVDELKVI